MRIFSSSKSSKIFSALRVTLFALEPTLEGLVRPFNVPLGGGSQRSSCGNSSLRSAIRGELTDPREVINK